MAISTLLTLLPKGKFLIKLLKLPIAKPIDSASSASALSNILTAQRRNTSAKLSSSLSIFAFNKG